MRRQLRRKKCPQKRISKKSSSEYCYSSGVGMYSKISNIQAKKESDKNRRLRESPGDSKNCKKKETNLIKIIATGGNSVHIHTQRKEIRPHNQIYQAYIKDQRVKLAVLPRASSPIHAQYIALGTLLQTPSKRLTGKGKRNLQG